MAQVFFETEQFDAAVKALIAEQPIFAERVLTVASERLKDLAQTNLEANGSVITGHLKNDSMTYEIKQIPEGGAVSEFSVNVIDGEHPANYAYYVEYGRGPVIAKNAPYLTFQLKDGSWVRKKSVAAAPAKPYFRPALATVDNEISEIAAQEYIKFSE